MTFHEFEQQNAVLAENQPEYHPLPVNINPAQPEHPFTFCIHFEPKDLENIFNNGGFAYFTQLTFGKNFQPVSFSTEIPWDFISPLTKEQLIKFQEEKSVLNQAKEIFEVETFSFVGAKRAVRSAIFDNWENCSKTVSWALAFEEITEKENFLSLVQESQIKAFIAPQVSKGIDLPPVYLRVTQIQ